MKKNYNLILFFIGIICLSSCGVVKNSGKYHEKDVSNQGIYTDILYADMEINEEEKITGEASATYFLFFRISGDNHYAISFYRNYVKGELHPTNARTAEMCKLVENSSRDVQIAFANELSLICDKASVNVWDLINLANKHPRVNILQP